MGHLIALTDDDLLLIRSALLRDKIKEDRSVARGEKLGLRAGKLANLLKKLPVVN